MRKLYVLLVLAALTQADNVQDAEKKLNELFIENSKKNNGECRVIEGELDLAPYECFLCDDARVTVSKRERKKIEFKSKDCSTVMTLCCLLKEDINIIITDLNTRYGDGCGSKDELLDDNRITQKRASVRSVLSREYPWRAWVYTKERNGDGKLVCAGTVVDANAEVVMTSASCVRGYQAGDLAVGFTRGDSIDAISLRSIVVHPSYDSSKQANDIALVILSKEEQLAPGWVRPVCLPTSPPLHASTCISISQDDYFLRAVVPTPKKCQAFNIKSELGQMCAVAPPNDYTPERGAALLCQDEQRTASELYFAAGVALLTSDSVTAYTDVHQFFDWILDVIAQNKS